MTVEWTVTRDHVVEAVGFLAGLGVTSVSLSSGFIWAKQGRAAFVFAAAFLAWWGYLFAHYSITGEFIDASGHEQPTERDQSDDETHHPLSVRVRNVAAGAVPESHLQKLGVVGGAGVLVSGMVVGVLFIRAENHVATNVGGVLFLGGYVIAHYSATDHLL